MIQINKYLGVDAVGVDVVGAGGAVALQDHAGVVDCNGGRRERN